MALRASSLYSVMIRTTPGTNEDSHYATLYVNSDASRVYAYQAFAKISSLEVTGYWTPAKILQSFTIMVDPAKKTANQGRITSADKAVLKAFKSDVQAYVDAIQSVSIVGPLAMPANRCKELADMSVDDFRVQGCQAMGFQV